MQCDVRIDVRRHPQRMDAHVGEIGDRGDRQRTVSAELRQRLACQGIGGHDHPGARLAGVHQALAGKRPDKRGDPVIIGWRTQRPEQEPPCPGDHGDLPSIAATHQATEPRGEQVQEVDAVHHEACLACLAGKLDRCPVVAGADTRRHDQDVVARCVVVWARGRGRRRPRDCTRRRSVPHHEPDQDKGQEHHGREHECLDEDHDRQGGDHSRQVDREVVASAHFAVSQGGRPGRWTSWGRWSFDFGGSEVHVPDPSATRLSRT